MKQRFYTSGLVFLVILSICFFTGCKDGKESNDNKSKPTSLDMSSWPDNLPKFEYGKLVSILLDEDTGEFKAATFSKIKNPETAYKNYKTALSNKGWVLDVDTSNEYVWAGAYMKDPKNVHVTVQKDGSAAQLIYLAE